MSEAHRVGITPYVLQLASHYATLGVGTYNPNGYAFDRIEVVQRMPWQPNPDDPMKSALIMAVEFYVGKHRQRFVEFALTPAGFGGDPIIKPVP